MLIKVFDTEEEKSFEVVLDFWETLICRARKVKLWDYSDTEY